MTSTADKQSAAPDVTKLAPRRHKWGDQINIHIMGFAFGIGIAGMVWVGMRGRRV